MADLDFIPTSELIDELHRRTVGGAVLCVMLNNLNAEQHRTHVYFGGGQITALGLCEYARVWLHNLRNPAPAEEE